MPKITWYNRCEQNFQKGWYAMFQKNDYVVYGYNGVCTVKDIGPLDIPGVPKERVYYTLVPYYTKDSQIFVPADSSKVVLRPVISKDEFLQLMEEIPSIDVLWVDEEKQRDFLYKETLRKCNCRELIQIIKTVEQRRLERIAKGKKMTSTDEKYFHLAEKNLYEEGAIALGIEPAQVKELVVAKLTHSIQPV